MKASRIAKIGLPVVALIAAGFYYWNTLKPTAIVAEARVDTAIKAVPGTVTVLAKKEMELKSEISGRIVESQLERGKRVQAGDLLIRLDTGDIDIEIDKARANLEAARKRAEIGNDLKYSLRDAQKRLADAEFRKTTVAASEIESLRMNVQKIEEAMARAEVDRDLQISQLENELKTLKRHRAKMSIYAPIDGIISPVYAFEGDLIGGGQQIARIVSLDTIVEVKVSEENFAGLEVGQAARVKFLGYPETSFPARVSRIINVADQTTQRYPLHLDVEIDPSRLYPGLTGEASITLDYRKEAVVVPRQAISGDSVYVVSNGVVRKRDIERGYASLTDVEVLGGLNQGEQVIVENLELFGEGDSVRTLVKSY